MPRRLTTGLLTAAMLLPATVSLHAETGDLSRHFTVTSDPDFVVLGIVKDRVKVRSGTTTHSFADGDYIRWRGLRYRIRLSGPHVLLVPLDGQPHALFDASPR